MSSHSGPAVTLYSAPSVDAAWDEVLRGWFQRASDCMLAGEMPCVVVVPSRSVASALKGRVLDEGLSMLGVRFWVPGELREALVAQISLPGQIADRNALPLITAVAAEETAAASARVEEQRVANSIARAPDAFLRACDQLDQGGWEPANHLPAPLRGLARRLSSKVAAAGFVRLASADRMLNDEASRAEKALSDFRHQISNVLIVGFDGAHWPIFPLLLAGARRAAAATVIFTEPRDEARMVDSLWIGSWEQEFSSVTPLAGSDRSRPMADVLRLPEGKAEMRQRSEEPADCVDFLVSDSVSELAEAIARRVCESLVSCTEPRIAVVFSRASALSRLVSMRLSECEVLHNDSLGHSLVDGSANPAWEAWLRLQNDRRVTPFQQFVRECGSIPRLGGLNADSLCERLTNELAELLIDDLPVLAVSLAARTQQPLAVALAGAIEDLVWLPERAEVSTMYTQTMQAMTQLGWEVRKVDFRRAVAGWIGRVSGTVSRRFWLQWIGEVLEYSERQREPAGRHPYARVHLISVSDAATQEWTHVVLAGLNEGAWPMTPEEDGWLSELEIVELNTKAQTLNREVVRQGRHGEGHDAIRAGHTWCLTGADARGILMRQFFNLLENTSERVTVTASMRSAEEPERLSAPGELFARLYFGARGRAMSPGILERLRLETSRWMNALRVKTRAEEPVRATQQAWKTRRREGEPFGEFEFCLRSTPSTPIELAATKWEDALNKPAHVFMEWAFGVTEPGEEDPDFTARAIGTWVHRWLAKIGSADGTLRELENAVELERIVRRSAASDRGKVESLLTSLGRRLPEWWIAIWDEALATAVALVRKIPQGTQWSCCATELRIGSMSLNVGGGDLRTRGRIDLLLAQSGQRSGIMPMSEVFIVDYKTGKKDALTRKGIAKGDGLQLALYGEAARALGATGVGMSRLAQSLDLAKAQLKEEDLDAFGPLWECLLQMQESGCFGMLGAIRSDYGVHAAYPLATLPIDKDLLEEKWALTHPKLGGLTK